MYQYKKIIHSLSALQSPQAGENKSKKLGHNKLHIILKFILSSNVRIYYIKIKEAAL